MPASGCSWLITLPFTGMREDCISQTFHNCYKRLSDSNDGCPLDTVEVLRVRTIFGQLEQENKKPTKNALQHNNYTPDLPATNFWNCNCEQ
eukprot:38057-Amphidinium_carterae.1